MASQIDPTVFPDNQMVDKADLRNQFEIAKNEITELQGQTTTAQRMVANDSNFDNI